MSANASRSRIQSLIMEVLNAHPSARDSKAYLQSFGISMPPPSSAQHQQQLAQSQPPSPIPVGTSTAAASHFQQHTALVKVQGPFTDRQLSSIADGLVYLKRLGLMSILVLDSERWPYASARFSQQGQLLVPRALLDPSSDATAGAGGSMDASALASGSTSMSRTPAALVGKAQEGLRKRMVHQVLRLSSLLEARGAPSIPLTQPLFRVDASAVQELHGRVPAPAPARQCNPSSSSSAASTSSASRARLTSRSPFLPSSKNQDELSIYQSPLSNRAPLVSSDGLAAIRAALLSDQLPVLAPIALYEDPHDQGAERALAVSTDDALVGLAREMSDAAIQAAERRRRHLSSERARDDEAAAAAAAAVITEQDDLDLMPLRLMVINREGGIPSHARGGNPHLSINLASEYSQIHRTFIWNRSHTSALRNLRTVKDCLAYMPHPTSSGVVVSHRSPKSLIANLITNKAAHSPSLPHRLLEGRNDVRHTPTIVRWGLPVRVLERIEDVEFDKLAGLLEVSFGRKLDRANYYERLRARLDFVIVAGDYQGAAIVTKEWAPGEEEAAAAFRKSLEEGRGSRLEEDVDVDVGTAKRIIGETASTNEESSDGSRPPIPLEPIAYLDKFAVLPSLRGSGVVDFLWGALRDEVHGLGLLDALNENGGKCGFGVGRDLVWKSRGENTVNRWYFERSNGFVRIPAGGASATSTSAAGKESVAPGQEPQHEHDRLPWVMFWCDAEERLANMSGEKRLGAEATYEDVLDMAVERERRRVEEEEEEEEDGYGGGAISFGASSASRASSDGRRTGDRIDGWIEDAAIEGAGASGEAARSGTTSLVLSRGPGRGSRPSSSVSSSDGSSIAGAFGSDILSPSSSSSASSATSLSASPTSSSSSAKSNSSAGSLDAGSSSSNSSGGGNLFTRLPHIAPEERGRLERWARCMASIPSAWL